MKLAGTEDYIDILIEFISFLEDKQFPNLVALYMGGSVARGDYSPGRSDVDLYAVLEERDPQFEEELLDFAQELGKTKIPGVIKIHPQPVGISFTTLKEIEEGKSFLGSGFEYWNFQQTGRLLVGREIKDLLPVPTREQEKAAAEDALADIKKHLLEFKPGTSEKDVAQMFSGVFRSACILLSGRGKYVSSKTGAVIGFLKEFESHPLGNDLFRVLDLWLAWGKRPLTEAEFAELVSTGRRVVLELCSLGLE